MFKLQATPECCAGSFAQEPGGWWRLRHDPGWLWCWAESMGVVATTELGATRGFWEPLCCQASSSRPSQPGDCVMWPSPSWNFSARSSVVWLPRHPLPRGGSSPA